MKRILKNKRGMAMESAILFMLITLMFGLLLTGVIMNTHLRVKVNNTLLSREITIEQIGENFVYNQKEFKLTDDDKKYLNATETDKGDKIDVGDYVAYVKINGSSKVLTLKNKSDKTLLYIEASDTTATCWRYSPKVTE